MDKAGMDDADIGIFITSEFISVHIFLDKLVGERGGKRGVLKWASVRRGRACGLLCTRLALPHWAGQSARLGCVR